MTWPQYLDTEGSFDRQFNVTGLPTYVLVDHEGAIVHRVSGWSSRIQGDLSSRIGKAIKEAKKAGAAQP